MNNASPIYIYKPICTSCKKELPSHYAKWCKPCHAEYKTKPLKDRLLKFIKKSRGCWEWIGARDRNGYGRFHNKYGTRLAHKLFWEINKGKVEKGISVCHKCDNPPCVKLSHLFVGTQLENSADASRKGRNNHLRKLTKEDVVKIRKIHTPVRGRSSMGHRKLSVLFGVARSSIRSIVIRKTWKHI